MWVYRLPVHIGPSKAAYSPRIFVKSGLFCRVDVGIDPYTDSNSLFRELKMPIKPDRGSPWPGFMSIFQRKGDTDTVQKLSSLRSHGKYETQPPKKGLWTRMNNKVRDFLASLCFSGPSFLGMLAFYIIPFLIVVYYSFTVGLTDHSFAGLKNYITVLQNGAFRIAVKNTFVFTGLSVPLAVVLSLGLALMLEARIPLKSEFRTFFLSPMMVPIASIILIWQVLFHYNGVINEFLQVFGADKIDWLKSDYCMVVVVVLFLWKNLGYNMILFMAALSNIPRELLEVAEVEGASASYQFFHIKLRYLSPTVLFVTILSIINSFKVFREIYLLTGNYPYDGLYMMQHFMNNMFNSTDYQRLSAAAVLLAIVIIILIAILFLIENVFGKDVEG